MMDKEVVVYIMDNYLIMKENPAFVTLNINAPWWHYPK